VQSFLNPGTGLFLTKESPFSNVKAYIVEVLCMSNFKATHIGEAQDGRLELGLRRSQNR
jgi:hypothetical protein